MQNQEKDLQQIADMLLLNGTLTECFGLVHGKMGVAVFFFHYAQHTHKLLFVDYALDMIREIQDQIYVNSPADYEKGIAGIGVGINYLIQNKLLIAEDDICEDLDQRMLRAVMYDPWQDFSMYDGLTGYGRYWISRLHQPSASILARKCLMHITEQIKDQLQNIPMEEQTDVYCFLHDLHEISGFDVCAGLLKQCQKQVLDISRNFPHLGDSIIGNIIQMHQRCRYFNDTTLRNEKDMILGQIPDLDMEKPPASMGLLSGYAGEGLLRLTKSGQTSMSWMQLL
jgi:hypothetical protein